MAKLSSIQKNSHRLKLIEKYNNKRKLLKEMIMKKDFKTYFLQQKTIRSINTLINIGRINLTY